MINDPIRVLTGRYVKITFPGNSLDKYNPREEHSMYLQDPEKHLDEFNRLKESASKVEYLS